MSIPTTQQCVDSAIAAIESNLGQDVPLYERSFLRVLSVVIGMTNSELYRFGQQRAKQILALTARGDDLTNIGLEYGIRRKPAEKAVILATVDLPATGAGTILQSDAVYDETTNQYFFPIQDYPFTGAMGSVGIAARAEFAGPDGNLSYGTLLHFSSTPENVTNQVWVYDIQDYGVDEETDEALRIRILDEIQSVGGGSNSADYRTWAQRCPNVYRADPYTGTPPWSSSTPGERTVYIEATTDYEADGIADAALLSLATDYINYDQDTGLRQPCLGSTDDTLFVYSITRNICYFNVRGMTVDPTKSLDCTNAINDTLDELARSMRPFILGLDSEAFRTDVMTGALAGRYVQRVVQAFGGYVGEVQVGTSLGVWADSLELNPGERFKAEVHYDY